MEDLIPVLFALYFIVSTIVAVVKRMRAGAAPPTQAPVRPRPGRLPHFPEAVLDPMPPAPVETRAPAPDPLPETVAAVEDRPAAMQTAPPPAPRRQPRRVMARPGRRLNSNLTPGRLKEAIVLAEIVGPPRAYRPFAPFAWKK